MENKKKYKIVACDLDGTLLSNDQTVSAENLKAIRKMGELGVTFVPATGRALNELPEDLIESPAVKYAITSNGAAIWDKEKGEMILAQYFSEAHLRLIFDTIRPYASYAIVHENGTTYYDKEKHTKEYMSACRIDDYHRQIIEDNAAPMTDFDNFLLKSGKVEMLAMFFDSDEALARCKRIFIESGKLYVVQSSKLMLEIFVSGAGKGSALSALADALSVDLADVIAVGDSDNDVSLLKAAGIGLAMGNASDALKEIADQTICNNSEHCAKYVLENIIKEQ